MCGIVGLFFKDPALDAGARLTRRDSTAALVALGDNDPHWPSDYAALGTTAGAYDDWHEGRDPAGKSHVHNLEPEDLVALTVEAAAMAGVPLAGTNWIPGAERR
jgi:hypothetical protein